MHSLKQNQNTNTQSYLWQQTATAKRVTPDAQGIPSNQRDPLVQQTSRTIDGPNPIAHAQILNLAPANQQSSNQQLLLQLQQQYGNSYVNQVLQLAQQMREGTSAHTTQKPVVQAKLTVNRVGDKYEQEADRIAAQVVQQINAPPVKTSDTKDEAIQREAIPETTKEEDKQTELAPPQPERMSSQNEKDQPIQMQPQGQNQQGEDGMGVTPELEASIQQAQGKGESLPEKLQQSMEQGFGADFSSVRIHVDTESNEMNQSLQARAFTVGYDIFFRKGAYDPDSKQGQELIAHELTHVIQQNGSKSQPTDDQEMMITKSPQGHGVQRLCSQCEQKKEKGIQAKEVPGGTPGANAEVEALISPVSGQVVQKDSDPNASQKTPQSDPSQCPPAPPDSDNKDKEQDECKEKPSKCSTSGNTSSTPQEDTDGDRESQTPNNIPKTQQSQTDASKQHPQSRGKVVGSKKTPHKAEATIAPATQANDLDLETQVEAANSGVVTQKAEATAQAVAAQEQRHTINAETAKLSSTEISFALPQQKKTVGEEDDSFKLQQQRDIATKMASSFLAEGAMHVQKVTALGQEIQVQIQEESKDAVASVRATIEQQKAAVATQMTEQRNQAQSEAYATIAHIHTRYRVARAAIPQKATKVRHQTETEYAKTLFTIDKSEGEQLDQINQSYIELCGQCHNIGLMIGEEAIALGEQKAKEWESQKIHRSDSLLEGPLTDRRLDARIDAARKVAKQFKCELINEANQQADELQTQKPKDVETAHTIAEQHRQQAQVLQQHTLENLSIVEEQTLSQLTEAQVKLTETANQNLQSTLQFLNQQEAVQLQVLEGYGQRQILAIERDAQKAIASLQNGVNEIATSLQNALENSVAQYQQIEVPNPEEFSVTLAEILRRFDNAVVTVQRQTEKGIATSKYSVIEGEKQAVNAVTAIAQRGIEESATVVEEMKTTLAHLNKGTTHTFNEIQRANTKTFTKTTETAIKGFSRVKEGIQTTFEQYLKPDRFQQSLTNLEEGLRGAIHGHNQQSEECAIKYSADKAAEQVQPWWKEALKWIITIIIITITIVVMVVFPPAGIIPMLLVGILLGVVSAIVIQIINNAIDGKKLDDHLLGAFVAGLIGGVLGGIGGVLGQVVIVATKLVKKASVFAVRFGFDQVFNALGTLFGDLAARRIHHEKIDWKEIGKNIGIGAAFVAYGYIVAGATSRSLAGIAKRAKVAQFAQKHPSEIEILAKLDPKNEKAFKKGVDDVAERTGMKREEVEEIAKFTSNKVQRALIKLISKLDKFAVGRFIKQRAITVTNLHQQVEQKASADATEVTRAETITSSESSTGDIPIQSRTNADVSTPSTHPNISTATPRGLQPNDVLTGRTLGKDTSKNSDLQQKLTEALPPKLQGKVPVNVDSTLAGNTVRVYYELDPETKLVTKIEMRVGQGATADDIKLHVKTVRSIQRYSGLLGRMLKLKEQILSTPVGSRAWEAKQEIKKLGRIIEHLRRELSKPGLDPNATTKLQNDINRLEQELAQHEKTLKDKDAQPGAGYVAMEASSSAPPPPPRLPLPSDVKRQPTEMERLRNLGLEDNEIAALQVYTGSEYVRINRYLRNRLENDDERKIQEFTGRTAIKGVESYNDFIKLITSILNKLPQSEVTRVTRGISVNDRPELLQELTDAVGSNKVVTESGFLSTSSGSPLVRDSIIIFDLPQGHLGKNVKDISVLGTEDEVLFPPNTRYQINKVVDKNDGDFNDKLQESGIYRKSLTEEQYNKVDRIIYANILTTNSVGILEPENPENFIASNASEVLKNNRALLESITSSSFRDVDIVGDGNCLFSSIARETGKGHEKVREEIVELLNNKQGILGVKNLLSNGRTANKADYLTEMRKDKTWGGVSELKAYSFKRDLVVVSDDSLSIFSEGRETKITKDTNHVFLVEITSNNPIYLSNNGVHFSLLIKNSALTSDQVRERFPQKEAPRIIKPKKGETQYKRQYRDNEGKFWTYIGKDDNEAHVLSRVTDKEQQLIQALPPKLQGKVPVNVDLNLTGNTVRVHYELDPETKLVTKIEMHIGQGATANDIKLHVKTVRSIQRYSGLLGRMLKLKEQILSTPVGSRAWEAKQEIKKLGRIIEHLRRELSKPGLDPNATTKLQNDINRLEQELAQHEKTLKDKDAQPGAGYVAMEASSLAPLPPRSNDELQEVIENRSGDVFLKIGDTRYFIDKYSHVMYWENDFGQYWHVNERMLSGWLYDPVKRVYIYTKDNNYYDNNNNLYKYNNGFYELVNSEINSASQVIVQGDYMSGDRYGIAAALIFNEDRGVLIITSNDTLSKGKELLDFYKEILKAQNADERRATLYNVGNRTPNEVYSHRNKFKEFNFESSISSNTNIYEATKGTAFVAEDMESNSYEPKEWQDYFAEQVLGGNKQGILDEKDTKSIHKFLNDIGLNPDILQKLAFIWAKTGSFDAEKAYHFADPTGLMQMINKADLAGRTPVLIGDKIEFPTELLNSSDSQKLREALKIWDFWNREDFPFKNSGRIGQLKFYRYLTTAENFDVVNIGMRSGGMEGPTLVGMQTIYLEEFASSQAARMEKWLQIMPNFHRIIIDKPAGIQQTESLIVALNKRLEWINQSHEQEIIKFESQTKMKFWMEKDKFIDFIKQHILKLRNVAEPGFTHEDLEAMHMLLKLENSQLNSFDTWFQLQGFNWKFRDKNLSFAQQYQQFDKLRKEAMSSLTQRFQSSNNPN